MLPGIENVHVAIGQRLLVIDKEATLFVHKAHGKGSVVDNVLDQGICLHQIAEDDFMMLPFQGVYGVMLPTKIMDETDEDITFRCITIDPMVEDGKSIKDNVRKIFD